jgi:D-glycero-D-manno-heptose 1,7-bisphosphate phosphatase
MRQLATEAGARIDAVFVCPHAPEDHCDCRKPLPGLILEAIEQAGIPRRNTVVVGDAARDLEAAAEAGVRAVLVRTGKGRDTENTLGGDEIAVYDHLDQAAAALLGEAPA